MRQITRIAPTPSGYLHVGNAFNAVLIWLWARKNDASIVLRIDDLDRGRVRPEYVDDVFRTLDWLGIDWDVGPETVDEFNKSWSQSLRIDLYDQAIRYLEENGRIYRCRCSRAQWIEYGKEGCHCTTLLDPFHSDTVQRLTVMPTRSSFYDQWLSTQHVTFALNSMSCVVRRRDGLPSYHIASIVDDVAFDIGVIIRGLDLIESTAFQCHLSELCGLPKFQTVQFMHHPLVKAEGFKLSKSAGSASLKYLRESGTARTHFYRWMSYSLGCEPASNATELLDHLPINIISSSRSLNWTKD